jgi:hypothetical protein
VICTGWSLARADCAGDGRHSGGPRLRWVYFRSALTSGAAGRSGAEGQAGQAGAQLAESEGAKFWLGVFNELRHRGVQDIYIACMDGLTGLPVAAAFPETLTQRCIVHLVRASMLRGGQGHEGGSRARAGGVRGRLGPEVPRCGSRCAVLSLGAGSAMSANPQGFNVTCCRASDS